MLFDFHRYQNELLPDSIYATYLVSGFVAATNKIPDAAQITSSSDLPESLTQVASNRKLTLVGEENLRDVLGIHTSVTSIHVYGLSPNTMKDFWLYEDAVNTNDIMIVDRKQAGLHDKHGAVRNPHMRLRDRKSQPNSSPSGHVQSVKQESEPTSHNRQTTREPPRQGKQQPVPKNRELASTSNRPAPKTIYNRLQRHPSML
ncbi:CDC27 protein, partial [Metarhizium acridum]